MVLQAAVKQALRVDTTSDLTIIGMHSHHGLSRPELFMFCYGR